MIKLTTIIIALLLLTNILTVMAFRLLLVRISEKFKSDLADARRVDAMKAKEGVKELIEAQKKELSEDFKEEKRKLALKISKDKLITYDLEGVRSHVRKTIKLMRSHPNEWAIGEYRACYKGELLKIWIANGPGSVRFEDRHSDLDMSKKERELLYEQIMALREFHGLQQKEFTKIAREAYRPPRSNTEIFMDLLSMEKKKLKLPRIHKDPDAEFP